MCRLLPPKFLERVAHQGQYRLGCLGLGLGHQRGAGHRHRHHQNGDDAHYHEQLDQGKGVYPAEVTPGSVESVAPHG